MKFEVRPCYGMLMSSSTMENCYELYRTDDKYQPTELVGRFETLEGAKDTARFLAETRPVTLTF